MHDQCGQADSQKSLSRSVALLSKGRWLPYFSVHLEEEGKALKEVRDFTA